MTKRSICNRCKRPIPVCFCENLISLENQWPIYIVQYHKENQHPLNTANIAKLGLDHCQILLSNDPDYKRKIDEIIEQRPLLIYPGENRFKIETYIKDQEITNKTDKTNKKSRPIIFLDGTWRKTRRLLYESPSLSQLQKTSINPNTLSRYKIRKAPNPDAVSTLEAIVYVLSLLEKEPSKYQPLLDTMDIMINKQIELMGKETYERNYRQKT